jgi:hypothetical protein
MSLVSSNEQVFFFASPYTRELVWGFNLANMDKISFQSIMPVNNEGTESIQHSNA